MRFVILAWNPLPSVTISSARRTSVSPSNPSTRMSGARSIARRSLSATRW